ncbi:MAG: hypothetical protein IKO47_01315 [Ruminococcus sp.]|nr:hypothetical protein [Ruminococcus sp.]
MNPMYALKYYTLLNKFKANHPKLPGFIKTAGSIADVGTVAEITVKTTAGKTIRANISITEEDIKILSELKALRKSKDAQEK